MSAGDLNVYQMVANNPIRYMDYYGLDIIINNTVSPIIVRGNPGTANGIPGTNQQYGVVSSDGQPHGGSDNPIPSY